MKYAVKAVKHSIKEWLEIPCSGHPKINSNPAEAPTTTQFNESIAAKSMWRAYQEGANRFLGVREREQSAGVWSNEARQKSDASSQVRSAIRVAKPAKMKQTACRQ
jgi:hypothetical protein